MVVGDDFYKYNFEFPDGDTTVGVALNATFVRTVLGCDGDEEAQRASIMANQEALIEEALSRRTHWFWLGSRSIYACMLGLTGNPQLDRGKRFPHLGWPKADAARSEQ